MTLSRSGCGAEPETVGYFLPRGSVWTLTRSACLELLGSVGSNTLVETSHRRTFLAVKARAATAFAWVCSSPGDTVISTCENGFLVKIRRQKA